MMNGGKKFFVAAVAVSLLWNPFLVSADDAGLKQDIDTLNSQVKQHEDHVKELDSMIQKYKSRISQNEAAVASLQNQVALLDNRIGEKMLAVQRTKEQMDITNLQIQSLDREIQLRRTMIDQHQESLSDLLRELQQADQVSLLDVFMARPSLSEFFSHLEELNRLEQDLSDATEQVKMEKAQLEQDKAEADAHRAELQKRKQQLEKEQQSLEDNRGAKVSLATVTQSKEGEFQRVIYELRQEQQSEADAIASIRDRLKDKLDTVDESLARGDILLSWPIRPGRGISATFHDPTYPFRKFFEHPGTDLPTPVGTPVRSAAGGYVAWNRTGKQYGNYIMVIHPGGIATIYAHLSGFTARPDTYVERGDIIGYSGGRPGDEGAGLSTGPHLHFEVRQNGIPVNPENFLPSLD